MKNLSLLLNVVLLVAVGILYYLHFSNANNMTNSESLEDKIEGKIEDSIAGEGLRVLHVNTDSVWNNFDFVKEMEDELIVEKTRIEGQFRSKVQKLEKDMIDFQRKAEKGLINIEEAQIQERDLMQRQQNLMEEKDELSFRLMNKEKEYNEKIQEAIYDYLIKNNDEIPYDYILGFSPGSGALLFANKKLDITEKVTKGLNESYNEKKTKK